MASFRDTFGITGHNDIISASLDKRTLYSGDFDNRYINFKNKDYILHCDAAVKQTLGLYGSAECLISYQERTTGFYAMARLYRSAK